ncbi:MAG: low specificity L-threonine aldolase [Edaphobacter sp.]|uniref:threonine aldolase family protein n=1 Tax=Edaphobacter sp. TaxID=1934404 RepID=UPI0023A4B2BC|nr:low specificity L-threonine aldolase [Edaphobacter sp.]MDE1177295.1 low specificity L-threonine aldolase [Edaphobacter sp.]
MPLPTSQEKDSIDSQPQQFASDNYSGICPDAWEAMAEANVGYARSYGEDEWTSRAAEMFRELFEYPCEVFFAFNGTAANSLALASLCQSYHGVVCADSAHVETDECGAPEFFSNGSKLLTVATTNGKILPEVVREIVLRRSDIHFPPPRALTISQATETGLVYRPDEIAALAETARSHKMHLHMDGARFSNACASLGCTPAEISWKAGVDVLCFGGTKNGMAVGEAIVFFNRELARDFDYRCKQAGQLASKMRFLTAPWIRMLENGSWLSNAAHANTCAQRFAEGIKGLDGIDVMFEVDANAVFVRASEEVFQALRDRGWRFYTFIGGGARFMFSWDSREDRINELLADFREIAG